MLVTSAYFNKFLNWLVKHAAWRKYVKHKSCNLKMTEQWAVMRTHLASFTHRDFWWWLRYTRRTCSAEAPCGFVSPTGQSLQSRSLTCLWSHKGLHLHLFSVDAKGFLVWWFVKFQSWNGFHQTSFGAINPLTLEFFLNFDDPMPARCIRWQQPPRGSVSLWVVWVLLWALCLSCLPPTFRYQLRVFVFFHDLYLSFVYISILPIFYPFTTKKTWYNKK